MEHLSEELVQKRSPIRATPPKLADRSTRLHRLPDAVPPGQTADLRWKEGAIRWEEVGRDYVPPRAQGDPPCGAWREGPYRSVNRTLSTARASVERGVARLKSWLNFRG